MERFDLVVIGGGTAGLVTAAGGAALGLKTALIEREALGGDCLWTGCVPSKALVAAARLAHGMRHADRLGLSATDPVHAFPSVMQRMRAARAVVARHDDPERFRRMGVEVILGAAESVGHGRVAADGRVLTSDRIVVATGAVPAVPPIEGLEATGYLTHVTAFDRDDLPARILMLGGGPLGLEFAQLYRRLGAEVTLLELLPRLLPREDADAAALLQEILEDEGIRVLTGTRVERVEGDRSGGKRVCARRRAGEELAVSADEIFVATGRRANGDGLGLERLGVQVAGGAVQVDRTLRAAVPGIWAAGDVTGGPQFTHVAEYHAKLVLRNAIFPFRARVDYAAVPMVTYTDPEVARVGLTEADARERYGDVEVYRYDLAELDRAIVDGQPRGFVKIVTRRGGRIVGATIVASGAGELIAPLVLAIKQRVRLPKLAGLVYPYPTMVEGIKRTADSYYRARLGAWQGRLLRRVVRWLA